MIWSIGNVREENEGGREKRQRLGREKEWPSRKRKLVKSREGQGKSQREVHGLSDGRVLQLTQKAVFVVVSLLSQTRCRGKEGSVRVRR